MCRWFFSSRADREFRFLCKVDLCVCIKMDEGITLTEGDVARIGIMKGLGEFTDLVIYNPDSSMEDIKLKAEKFGIKEGQKFFDWVQELRVMYLTRRVMMVRRVIVVRRVIAVRSVTNFTLGEIN